MKPALLLASLTIGALLASQPLTRAADPAPGDDYEPLALGQDSLMTATQIGPDGAKQVGTAHQRVEEAVMRNGQIYFRFHTWTEGWLENPDFTDLLRKDEKAFYRLLEDQPDAVEEIDLVLPLKVGNSWSHKGLIGTLKTTVLEQEDVTVNGKTYSKCFHTRTVAADGSHTEDSWDAPGVGTVRSDTVFKGGARILLEIQNFTPGK